MGKSDTIEGLPVPGYRPQTSAAIESVTAAKEIEEHVLRLLDELQRDTELLCDQRWLAIGRSHIEQGFMAVNRSIFKPARALLEAEPVQAWLIERADSPLEEPLFYAPVMHGEQWTRNRRNAIRFAREVDAAMLAIALAVQCRVSEHELEVA
jgi:hypothetical protein